MRRVAEQLVDRPVAEHVVGDRLHERLALGAGEREALLRERLGAAARRPAAQIGLGDALVVEERAQLVDHELVHLLAHVLERLRRAGRRGARAAAAATPCQRTAALAASSWIVTSRSARPHGCFACGCAAPLPLLRADASGTEQRLGDVLERARRPAPSGRRRRPGRPRSPTIGTAMSSGIGKFALEPEHALDLLHVELHLRVRAVEHEPELRAGDRRRGRAPASRSSGS